LLSLCALKRECRLPDMKRTPPDPLHGFLLAFSDLVWWLLCYRARTRKVKAHLHFGQRRPIKPKE